MLRELVQAIGIPLLVLLLAVLAREATGSEAVTGALRGMGVVAAALIGATAAKVAGTLKSTRLGLVICALLAGVTVVAVGVLRWPMAWVLVGLLPAAWALAWWRLRP